MCKIYILTYIHSIYYIYTVCPVSFTRGKLDYRRKNCLINNKH